MTSVPFRTLARTIDHLGREQIADCPTAVSELWKNAYDAYARQVALHIFDGDIPVAAVVDDGHGMSSAEFVDRWLTVGTESKVADAPVPEADRDGLPERVRQGQKGIGRLSVAHLGPAVVVLSKRRGHPFLAAMVDWRLFENPYLVLADVRVPVRTFEDRGMFPTVFADLMDAQVDNVWGSAADPARRARVTAAWERHDAQERRAGLTPTTSERIADTALRSSLGDRHLREWPVWADEAEHGTALFVLDLNRELRIWVEDEADRDDPEVQDLKQKIQFTLNAFVDPFSERSEDFAYGAYVHRGEQRSEIVEPELVFGREDLRELEHVVEGRFDEAGVFEGRVRAFGVDRGPYVLAPSTASPGRGRGWVGPFEICVGTFEQERPKSTHPADVHAVLLDQADRYAGLLVVRDSIRVLPYGRPDWDFFQIEERRSLHAGRHFWSHRRVFGRVRITRADNPNLRDKAGREGLIDNQARRMLQFLVINLLESTARRFFGTDSDIRQRELPEIQARNQRAIEAEKRAARRRRTGFREALKNQAPLLENAIERANRLRAELARAKERRDRAALEELYPSVTALRSDKADLRLPPRPRDLKRLEEAYRRYRDLYAEYCALAEAVGREWEAAAQDEGPVDPAGLVRRTLGRHQKGLSDLLGKYLSRSRSMLAAEADRLAARVDADRSRYYQLAQPIVAAAEDGSLAAPPALGQLEEARERLAEEFRGAYEPYLRALEQLAEGIDLDSALAYSVDEREELERRVEQVNALAQLGITVEIVGHELHDLESQVSRNLRRLPQDARDTDAFRLALAAHQALTERLRQLTPLRLAGPRVKEDITGAEVEEYLRSFFGDRLAALHIDFGATPRFRDLRVTEYRHRLYPVFVNLVNNALYWVRTATDRRILLDRVEGAVVVADTGPGVDPDDVPHLSELFFSRRVNGRGVGLYLSRLNLEAGSHRLEYAADGPCHVLPGANFVIRFRGEGGSDAADRGE